MNVHRIDRHGRVRRVFHYCCGMACVAASTMVVANATADEPGKTGSAAGLRFHTPPKPLSARAVTSDWPSFLGPTRDGVSPETQLLKKWPTGGPKLVWEMDSGSGYAAPAVVKDRLVFFHRVGDEAVVDCLHVENGSKFWSFSYPTDYKDRYGFSNGPRCSPAIDDGLVFVHGAEGKLHCLDLYTGKLVWQHDLSGNYKVPQDFFGVVSSPLVWGDVLIVNVGAPGGPAVLALNKRTGKIAWQAGDQWGPSCTSPLPAKLHGKDRVLVLAGGDSRPPTGGLLVINPVDGHIDLRYPFRGERYESVSASNPVIAGESVFLSTSYGTGAVLLDLLKDGQHRVAWESDEFGAHFATPIVHDGFLYGFDGSGKAKTALACIDLATGKQRWREQPVWDELIEKNGKPQLTTFGIFTGTIIRADGHFLCLGEMGHLLWLDLTPTGYKELARTWLFAANESWTPPVISRGLLYVTQNGKDFLTKTPPRLLCYDLRQQ